MASLFVTSQKRATYNFDRRGEKKAKKTMQETKTINKFCKVLLAVTFSSAPPPKKQKFNRYTAVPPTSFVLVPVLKFAHAPRCAFAPACELQCKTWVDWKSHVRKAHQNKLMRL